MNKKQKNMKKALVFIVFLFSLQVNSQEYFIYDINFEDTSQFFRINIDTSTNPNNVWQIGKPQKTIFTAAYSFPNVIVTDTINSYPPNDTSNFIITHIAQDGIEPLWGMVAIISGYYKCDSDSLNDFGSIEFSPDKGVTWVDLIGDPIYYDYIFWDTEKPVLTGKTTEWRYFSVNFYKLGEIFDIADGDTLLYRFSFISDSLTEQRDGLMYDNLHFEDWSEAINEITRNNFISKSFPNPSKLNLTIEFVNNRNNIFDLTIFNSKGGKVAFIDNITESKVNIDVRDFSPGLYLYKLTNLKTKQNSIGKIMISQ